MTTREDELTYAGHLVAYNCWCGIHFGVPSNLMEEYERRAGQMSIYCPRGHSMVPGSGSLKKKLDRAEARERHLQDQLEAAERTRRALRGHLTRLRNRIAAGVCPWCQRTFQQVERHVATKHPERLDKMHEAMDA